MKQNKHLILTGFPKITFVFFAIVIVVFLNTAFNYYLIQRENKNLEKITESINPYLDELDELCDILIESKMYATNWVHLPNNIDDKNSLDSLHRFRYLEIRKKIGDFVNSVKKNNNKVIFNSDSIIPIFMDFETLVQSQRKIMQLLRNFEDYENPSRKFKAEEIIEEEIIPKSKSILKRLTDVVIQNKKQADKLKLELQKDSKKIILTLIISSFGLLFFIITAIYFISININKPVLKMKSIIEKLAKGELTYEKLGSEKNVIGEMAISVNKLSESFKKTSEFANEIEHGNLSANYIKLGENDTLGNALINMRDSLLSYSFDMENQVKERTNEVVEKSLKIEEQKLFYESIFSNIPIDIVVFNEKHQYMFINSIAIKNEETRNFMIGKDDFDYCKLKNIDTAFATQRRVYFETAKNTGIAQDFEDQTVNLNGSITYKLRKYYPVFDNNGFKFMIGYGIDVTNKKLDEIKIQESLIEKEALLGEIHHRVKNNLTLVLGLIEMQKETLSDEKLINQFIEIRNRIAAMSLIHDKMYRGESFANIDLNEYLTDLISAIAKFYSKDKAVKLIFELEKIFISSKSAVSLALLVNEIVTNAFKYAFINNKDGVLKSVLSKDEKNFILEISDNGNGLPPDFDIKKTKSLGFKLFNIFVKQLKGKFEYFNDNGLKFVISWPQPKEVNN